MKKRQTRTMNDRRSTTQTGITGKTPPDCLPDRTEQSRGKNYGKRNDVQIYRVFSFTCFCGAAKCHVRRQRAQVSVVLAWLGWEGGGGGGGVTGRFGMLNWRRGFSLRDCTFYFGANAMREMPSANLLQMKETRTRPRNNHKQSTFLLPPPQSLPPHIYSKSFHSTLLCAPPSPRLLSLSHAALYAKCSHFQLN